jgi:hypothetical protein
VVVAQATADLQQRHAVEVEHRLGLRMVAGLHPVAGQAQHVGHAHGRAAQDVALDRDAVLVAAGDLHHGAYPLRVSNAHTARLDMWQLAPLPSVALIAST